MSASLLTDHHRSRHVRLIEFQGALWPAQFTDPLQEYAAVQSRAGVFDGSALGILELTGSDRAAFLQGLVTNDMKHLARDRACWACMLMTTGHVTSLLLIVHREMSHWIIVPRWLIPRVREFFERYRIAEDVQIADRSAAWQVVGLQGPAAPDAISAIVQTSLTCAPQTWAEVTVDGSAIGVLGHDPLGLPGALCVVPSAAAVSWWERCVHAGATPAGLLALQMLRVEAGVVWYGVDADETCLLPETGWERTATSDTKGCYVGQEIVARVAHQGHVNRHLVGLKLSTAELPTTPCELLLNERSCGRLTSVAHSLKHSAVLGLAMVSRAAWTPGARLTLAGQPGITAELIALLQLQLPA